MKTLLSEKERIQGGVIVHYRLYVGKTGEYEMEVTDGRSTSLVSLGGELLHAAFIYDKIYTSDVAVCHVKDVLADLTFEEKNP